MTAPWNTASPAAARAGLAPRWSASSTALQSSALPSTRVKTNATAPRSRSRPVQPASRGADRAFSASSPCSRSGARRVGFANSAATTATAATRAK